MDTFPFFSSFVLRAQEKDGRTCINGLPVASPSKQMLGRFPMLQALHHDNLAAYLYFSETVIARDLVIIVQEHFQTSLADVIKSGFLKDEDVENVILDITVAMEALHEEGVIHGLLSLDSTFFLQSEGKTTVKLSGYGLPFLTNYGEDIASPLNESLCLSPERLLLNDDYPFCETLFQSDIWAVGIVFLQLYLGVDFEEVMTDAEYSDILNKLNDPDADECNVLEEIIQLLKTKNVNMKRISKLEWLEEIINKCLQVDFEKRPRISEIGDLVRSQVNTSEGSLNKLRLKTVQEMRESIEGEKEIGQNTTGFEKLSIENAFHLWKMCGSTPERILLKKGIIQNHAPISSYPCVLFDDFHHVTLEEDDVNDEQSTFELGVFELPRKRVEERLEKDQKISARLFNNLRQEQESVHYANILYETSCNMLTVEHFLNATAVGGLANVVPRLAEMQIVSTQRADVWRELLEVTAADWREFLDLDILAPHSSDRQLEVDIPRCHQYDSFMTTPAIQESLRKVLKGWQILTENDNYVYWQGCDSLATPFLLTNMSKPHVAYACFRKFANRYCHKFYLKDNSEVIKEYLGIFYHLVAYVDPVLYKHLKVNGFDAELFAIPWFLTCFAHELPLSKLFVLWDEIMMHGNSFPLMVALAMLSRLRDKLLSVSFNEMIIIIHDQPDLAIEEVIRCARLHNKTIPPSCAFRAHASPWKETYAEGVHSLPMSMSGLSLTELAAIHCPRLSTEELMWRTDHGEVFVLDTRSEAEFLSGHFPSSFHHPPSLEADIDWLAQIPGIGKSNWPKCIVYNESDSEAAQKLAETYVMKGVPYMCLLHEPYEKAKERAELKNSRKI